MLFISFCNLYLEAIRRKRCGATTKKSLSCGLKRFCNYKSQKTTDEILQIHVATQSVGKPAESEHVKRTADGSTRVAFFSCQTQDKISNSYCFIFPSQLLRKATSM